MRKIKAFTLIEMIVVMMMMSIVFVIAYYAFKTVVTFQLNQNKISMEIEEYRTLNKLLENDFMNSNLTLQNQENGITHTSPKRGPISYLFSESFICRTDNCMTDTFHIKSQAPVLSTKYLLTEDRMVNEMEVFLFFHDKPIALHFQKSYSPEITINKEIEKLRNELH